MSNFIAWWVRLYPFHDRQLSGNLAAHGLMSSLYYCPIAHGRPTALCQKGNNSQRIAGLCSKILRTCAVIHLLVPAKVPNSIPHQHWHFKHHWPKWQSSFHGKYRVHSKLAAFWVIQQMDQSGTLREGICLQNPKRCRAFVLVREGARYDNPSFLYLRMSISTCPHIMTPRNFTEMIGP